MEAACYAPSSITTFGRTLYSFITTNNADNRRIVIFIDCVMEVTVCILKVKNDILCRCRCFQAVANGCDMLCILLQIRRRDIEVQVFKPTLRPLTKQTVCRVFAHTRTILRTCEGYVLHHGFSVKHIIYKALRVGKVLNLITSAVQRTKHVCAYCKCCAFIVDIIQKYRVPVAFRRSPSFKLFYRRDTVCIDTTADYVVCFRGYKRIKLITARRVGQRHFRCAVYCKRHFIAVDKHFFYLVQIEVYAVKVNGCSARFIRPFATVTLCHEGYAFRNRYNGFCFNGKGCRCRIFAV